MLNNKRGVTLIELIVAIALLTIVISVSFSILSFGNRLLGVSSEEYDLQASTRAAMETLNTELRFSTATFALPMSSFTEANLTPGFEYFGVTDDGKEIVQYFPSGDPTNPTWNKRVLVSPQEGLEYRMIFQKIGDAEDDKLISFHFEAGSDSGGYTKIGLGSELEALQSRSIRDMGTTLNPAQVIAFTRNPIQSHRGNIAMVLDLSGSMDRNMSGGGSGKSRLSILKEEASKLVNGLASEDNVYISLVPFATNANNPHSFVAANNATALTNQINGFSASGGTNTGDGIRRAYYQLTDAAVADPVVTHSNYAIILVDGVTTFSTARKDHTNYNIVNYTGNGNVLPFNRHEGSSSEFRFNIGTHSISNPSGQIVGRGNNLDSYGTAYVDAMGALLQNQVRRVYVIGFSAVSSELQSVNDIASAVGASSDQVFIAGSQEDLDAALEEIREDIINDFWFLRGPSY